MVDSITLTQLTDLFSLKTLDVRPPLALPVLFLVIFC